MTSERSAVSRVLLRLKQPPDAPGTKSRSDALSLAMIPLWDDTRRHTFPFVTIVLIAINLWVYLRVADCGWACANPSRSRRSFPLS